MTDAELWRPLDTVLARYRDAGRRPVLWLRDDDAVEPTPALDRLLDTTRAASVPLLVASIPAGATPALAGRLAREPHVRVAVHGWSHANHAPPGRKTCELGADRPAAIVLGELQRGLVRLGELFGAQLDPVLVPPWNRIDKGLLPALPSLGYAGLSVFGSPFPAPLAIVNSTVDIIDWRGTRGGRDIGELASEVAAGLQAALADSAAPPVGLLTHHLVHDEAAWHFLEELFVRLPDAEWTSCAALVAQAQSSSTSPS